MGALSTQCKCSTGHVRLHSRLLDSPFLLFWAAVATTFSLCILCAHAVLAGTKCTNVEFTGFGNLTQIAAPGANMRVDGTYDSKGANSHVAGSEYYQNAATGLYLQAFRNTQNTQTTEPYV